MNFNWPVKLNTTYYKYKVENKVTYDTYKVVRGQSISVCRILMERTTPMHHNRSIISEMETYKSELKFSTREFIHTLIIPLRVVVIPKTRTTKLVRTELLSSVTNQEYVSIYCTFQEIQYVFCGV